MLGIIKSFVNAILRIFLKLPSPRISYSCLTKKLLCFIKYPLNSPTLVGLAYNSEIQHSNSETKHYIWPHNSQGVPCFGCKINCRLFYQIERQAEIIPMPPDPLKGE